MKAIYALYRDPGSAQEAWRRLVAAGVDADAITVASSEPFEQYEFSRRHSATWLYWIAVCGGAIGLLLGYWLTSMTERSWPLPTGGMPIVAMWPNLIVIFEMTMLGGVLATVIGLLVGAGLPARTPRVYDREVADGNILVGVENPPDASIGGLERALRETGAAKVKTIDS
jgi:hypothetical protein